MSSASEPMHRRPAPGYPSSDLPAPMTTSSGTRCVLTRGRRVGPNGNTMTHFSSALTRRPRPSHRAKDEDFGVQKVVDLRRTLPVLATSVVADLEDRETEA